MIEQRFSLFVDIHTSRWSNRFSFLLPKSISILLQILILSSAADMQSLAHQFLLLISLLVYAVILLLPAINIIIIKTRWHCDCLLRLVVATLLLTFLVFTLGILCFLLDRLIGVIFRVISECVDQRQIDELTSVFPI